MAEQSKVQGNEEVSEGSPQKKGKSKLIPIVIGLALLLGVAGYFANKQILPEDDPSENSEQSIEPSPVVEMAPFVVNLMDDGDMPRYLKIHFSLELRPGSREDEMEAKKAALRDAIIVLLTSKRSADLNSIEGKDRLRDEIITRMNSRLRYSTVNRVFFKEFIIQ